MANIPWWMLALLVFIDFGVPLGLLIAGIWLIRRTLKNRKRTDVLECAKCRYDMRASPTLTCPECGYVHQSIERLYPGSRRVNIKVTVAVLLCLPGLWGSHPHFGISLGHT